MHADQLRVATNKVVDTLAASGVLEAIREYRTAKGDQRPVAAARLGHAGAMLMESMGTISQEEEAILKLLHLDSVRTTGYWQNLLSAQKPEAERSAELVHLYSRVLFASNHLPNFAALLNRVTNVPRASAAAAPALTPLQTGESRLAIQLSDAGERASDPDRIARSIDGIDMLYSACASLSRRPALDLRLDHIVGVGDRQIVFTGESEGVAAMAAVIDSIPSALASLNDDQEIDLDALVDTLPIFKQLNTLAGHGAFSEKDLRDIRETMHQGALLTLESGVVLTDSEQPRYTGSMKPAGARTPQLASTNGAVVPTNAPAAGYVPSPANGSYPAEPVRDEHYERYLAERAAMQKGANGSAPVTQAPDDPFPMLGNAVQQDYDDSAASTNLDKQSAVDELLKTLNRQRDG